MTERSVEITDPVSGVVYRAWLGEGDVHHCDVFTPDGWSTVTSPNQLPRGVYGLIIAALRPMERRDCPVFRVRANAASKCERFAGHL